MDLHAVATFFDRTQAADAYDPEVTFMCQVEPLDMYRVQGTRVRVRDMSVAPAVVMPGRRVINIDGDLFLVSVPSTDHWEGTPIRRRHVLQGVDALAEVYSIPEILDPLFDEPLEAYASIDFNKYSTDERDSSDYHAQFNITFANEDIAEDSVIFANGTYYLVRQPYKATSGLMVALSNELKDPITTVKVSNRVFDPVTELWTGTDQTLKAMVVRWTEHFQYLSQGSEKFERGDMQALVPVAVTAAPNDLVEIGGHNWRVLSGLTYTGYRSLHVRRA